MAEEKLDLGVMVKFFASCRETIFKDTITLKLIDQMTVRDLGGMILKLYPSLASKIQFVVVAYKIHKIADDATPINQMDEVAILPLVSGG
ncbi:MAG: MoaD/ThiS family protein [Candidatus Nitrosopolaris sp.]